MPERKIPKRYAITSDVAQTLIVLFLFLIGHTIVTQLFGIVQQVVYLAMITMAVGSMYIAIRKGLYWHMLIFAVIGMMSVFASLVSIGHLL